MTDEQASTGKLPTWGQGLLLGGGGILVATGGCAAFVSFGDGLLGSLGAIAFVGGLVAVPVGGIMFIVGVIKALFSSPDQKG